MVTVIVALFVSLLNLILGLSALIKAKAKRTAFWYFIISLVTVLWSVPLALISIATTPSARLLLARITFIGPVFLPLALNYFIRNFNNNSIRSKKGRGIKDASMIMLTFSFFWVSQYGNDFITRAQTTKDGSTIYSYSYQYILFFIFLAIGIGYQLYKMYKRYTKQKGIDRLRTEYLVTGFSLTAGIALTTNMLLPLLGVEALSSFGPISTLFLFYFTTQTMIQHRLFDIQTFIGRLLEVLTLSFTFYLVIFLVRSFEIKILQIDFYDPLNIFIDLVFAFFVAIEIRTILKYIEKVVRKIIPVNRTNLNIISKEIDKLEKKDLSPEKFILALQKSTLPYIPQVKFHLDNNPKLIRRIEKSNIKNGQLFIIQESTGKRNLKKYLKTNKHAILGLISEELCFIVHEKQNLNAFTKNELETIEFIFEKLRIIINQKELFNKTQEFNKILKKKVDTQTKKLKKAYEDLKTLDDAKSQFISMASHQLRTPISIMKGYIAMILDGDFGEVERSQIVALEKTSDSINQLNSIVEDILNASRIERGRLTISPVKTDLIPMINNIVEQMQNKAIKKKLMLSFITKEKECIANIDPNKMFEVILNLVDNAIQYTLKGEIKVSLEKKNKKILISVKDTGIGIPDDFKDKMFERFSRSENAKAVRPDGTGIGLFVVKSFVEAHNGKIWFDSEVGKGTTFYIELKG